MKYHISIFAMLVVVIVRVKSIPVNNRNDSIKSTIIQSTYAKVAKWGANPTVDTVSQARSNNGQTLFSQRSDVNIMNGQNMKKKPEITYHYSMLNNHRPVTISRVGHNSQEKLPASGEVIQERYNPKPYFEYSPIPPKDNKVPQSEKDSGGGAPSVVYGTPFDSFPSFPKPVAPPKTVVDIKPSISIYNSPYDSYNPPAPSPDAKPSTAPLYPPNDMPPSGPPEPTYLPPSNSYLPAKKPMMMMSMPKPSAMDGPPSDMADYSGPYAPPSDDPPKDDHDHDHHHHGDDGDDSDGPPIVKTVDPPMEPDQPYYDHPPKGYFDHHHHHHHDDQQGGDMMGGGGDGGDMMGDGGDMMGAGGDDDMSPPPAPQMNDHGHSAPGDDMSSDLSPPPSAPANGGSSLGFSPKLPDYMDHDPGANGGSYHGYQFGGGHHYDDNPHHHVYHEVTTTTTEAPEDERVNKGHYSYYYLGRKLWYIPLYFSVYFILYITALILKSIARHKVNLVHEYDKGKGRSFEGAGRPDMDEIQRKVARAIDEGAQKYAM